MVVEIVIVIAIVVTANNDQGIHQDNLRELNVTTRRLIDESVTRQNMGKIARLSISRK